jgi:RNA polymerase sigma-32 factor
MSGQDVGFDQPEDDDDDRPNLSPVGFLEDLSQEPSQMVEDAEWEDHSKQKLMTALQSLDERSRDIITQRWLSEQKSTLHELANKYSISAERIRQLENNAIKKLRGALAA